MRRWVRPFGGYALAVATLAVDQISKAVVVRNLPLHDSRAVVADFVRITHTRNPGIAFGVSLGVLNGFFLTLLTAAAAVGIALYLRTQRAPSRVVALGLALGGALGNLVDRVRLGEVVDFIDVGVGRHRWPVFNVADAVVVIGVLVLLWVDREDTRAQARGG